MVNICDKFVFSDAVCGKKRSLIVTPEGQGNTLATFFKTCIELKTQ